MTSSQNSFCLSMWMRWPHSLNHLNSALGNTRLIVGSSSREMNCERSPFRKRTRPSNVADVMTGTKSDIISGVERNASIFTLHNDGCPGLSDKIKLERKLARSALPTRMFWIACKNSIIKLFNSKVNKNKKSLTLFATFSLSYPLASFS